MTIHMHQENEQSISNISNYPWLDHIWLEITNRCNLRCVHCYANSKPENELSRGMTLDNWMSVIEEAAELNCQSVQFIGGEPVLYPYLPQLVAEARLAGIPRIEVFTNGIKINENLCKVLYSNSASLAFSVYGATPETHDAVTTVQGSFVRTIRAIRLSLQHDIPVGVGIISMSENKNEIIDTRHYLESLGVDPKRIGIDRLRGFGRGHDRVLSNDPYKEICGLCWKGRLAINDIGLVSPCIMSRFCTLGHVSSGLRTILQSQTINEFRLKVQKANSEPGCSPGWMCRCSS